MRLTNESGLMYRCRIEAESTASPAGLCIFWLVQAVAMADQVDRAPAVFKRAAGFANDLGLLAEEVDADTGELLGNFPRASSDIGLVNAAWAISGSEPRARS